jgi:Ribonuclease G/E
MNSEYPFSFICWNYKSLKQIQILGLGGKSTGVSKKIIGQERRRLKDIANLFRKPGFDLTARTEAAGQSQEDLEKDMLRLMETWNSILEQAEAASTAADNGQDGAVPVVLHRAMGQTLSIVRDFFAEKVINSKRLLMFLVYILWFELF